MRRRLALVISFVLCAALLPGAATAAGPAFSPGAPGVGDPYYPLDGNGGYDVQHYDLELGYDPATDVLGGTATITARATQDLSAFDLDFVGMHVRAIKVDGRGAAWSRSGQELTITPRRGIPTGTAFTIVVRYDGVPEPTFELFGGQSGFIATTDGAIIAGQPHGAATWFPANDHPADKASFTYHVSVPKGLQVVANGTLEGQTTSRGWTTWTWDARDPMATYLATVDIGAFRIHSYRRAGIRFWDAIDPVLFDPWARPHTGTQFLYSMMDDSSYKRLARTISVPASGASLSFWVNRYTEPEWDFLFVEAHTVGADDWTTLPDLQGHTSDDTGFSCPFGGWQGIHPFLAHYQTDNGDGTCTPSGSTGTWSAASGVGDGWERWTVDLSPYAGGAVEVSISYASDEIFQHHGVFIDDIEVSSGAGSTSFEPGADPLNGWTVAGPPAGSPANDNSWTVGTTAINPPSFGANAEASFARQPEMLDFLATQFGPYPWKAGGGIVDGVEGLGFALETQTRPIYSKDFFEFPGSDSVVVHENAHQWYGDSVAVERWQHIWLNEGFATYAEWLWSEHEGQGTPQEIFDFWSGIFPDGDPFWSVTIGDPGPGMEFDFAVYVRGAMTLQALRQAVGDGAFFTILKRWAQAQAGGNVTTDEFIALAERISGQDLGDLFDTWLFTPSKPVPVTAMARRSASSGDLRHAPPAARSLLERYGADVLKRLAH